MHLLSRAALLAALSAAPLAAQADDPAGLPTELGQHYGFLGPEVSRFNDGLGRLQAGDLDGDGVADLAVINNARARIQLLLRRRADEAPGDGSAAEDDKVNELADEGYFHRESVAVEEKVGSLALHDMDGDGRCELLFTGDSGRLTVAWHAARGGTARSVRLRLPDAGFSRVRGGDVDGDGRADALVCGAGAAWIFRQRPDGGFGEPQTVPLGTAEPDGFELLDIDGDRKLDLLLIKAESEWPLRWRLGDGAGGFGDERSAHVAPIRAWAVGDADGDGRPELAVVRRQSGRVSLLRYRAEPAGAGLELGAVRVQPLESIKDPDKRDMLLADLDGDGAQDLLVTEPSAARVALFRGVDGAARVVPSLLGASHPRLLPAPQGVPGGPSLVIAAPDEGAIGVAALGADGLPAFPRALPLPPVGEGADAGHPELLALDVGPAPAGGHCIWAVVASGKGRSRVHVLALLDTEGRVLSSSKLADVKTDPRDLLVADLDRDGDADALLCLPGESPRILLAQPDGAWKDLNVAQSPGLGLLDGLPRGAFDLADVDGDGIVELLVPGPNFARAVHLDAAGQPVVVAQANLPDPAASVACVAALDVDGDGRSELALADRASKTLHLLGRGSDGAFGLMARAELPDFLPRALLADRSARPGGRQRLVLAAADRFAVLAARAGGDATFLPDLDFEVPVKDAYVSDIAVGDVNADGTTDLVMTETRRHQLVIARASADALDFALRFPVYEERLFESGRSSQEPREVLVADVTGDGLPDLAILVHDRVLVYPQEPAP
jgi:FG-GAP-like repeat